MFYTPTFYFIINVHMSDNELEVVVANKCVDRKIKPGRRKSMVVVVGVEVGE